MQQNNSKLIFFLLSLSFLATLTTQIRPDLIISYGMSSYFFNQGNYIQTIIQLFSSQFIHGDFLHLLFNCVFVFIFGNYIAKIISARILTLFFISSSIFIGICLLFFSKGITIGMSGFALALLSFYALELYNQKNNEYKGALFAILLNIIIGFTPGISLLGHFFGAIWGILFFIIYKLFKSISSAKIN